MLHQNAAARSAAFAIVGKDHEHGGVERALKVCIVEDHERALAAQLHAVLLEPRHLHDALARRGRSGERYGTHIGVPDQRLPGVLAIAMHHVQHARRNARFQRQFAQTRRRHGRELAHLEHGGVAERKTGRDLPGGRHERHVPRRDQRAYAHRVKERVVQMRGRGVGVAVHAGAHFGEVVKIVGSARHELFAGLRDHLAAIVGLGV
ncbi:hypothetical protein SDC9_146970 [bioreactor metagenome]|uniref:Uncharacterized protein n=1 Tax=bioreactor metagenome TaxID=1076179 RepID=A0A645EDH8_9ZZZZ